MTHAPSAPSHLDPALSAAVAALTTNPREVTAVGGRPFLARATDEHGDWRLHRWPDGTPEARVRFAQRLTAALAGPATHDKPRSVLVDGAWVDREPWRPGDSLVPGRERRLPNGHALHVPAELSAEAERRLIQAVARVHGDVPADALAPVAPLDRVLRIVQASWREARDRLRPIAREHPPVQRWLRTSEQLLPAAEEAIAAAAPSFRPPAVCHLALWPGHAITSDAAGEIALIDWSMAAATTPLLDIAQLVVRFNGWTGQTAERVLGEYTGRRPLGPDERRVLPAFAALDLVIEAARLLAFGYGRGDEHASDVSQTARAGALQMLNSMDALHPAVVRAADPVPFAKRKRLTQHAVRPTRPGRRDR